jgi:hypothetical protein
MCRTAVAVRILSQRAELVAGNKGTILKALVALSAISPALVDPYLLCYQPRPRCAATTRLPFGTCQIAWRKQHVGTLGYFVIAVGAAVAASGIIGYILASMLIRRYEKADRPFKTSRGTTIQPISYLPVLRQLQPLRHALKASPRCKRPQLSTHRSAGDSENRLLNYPELFQRSLSSSATHSLVTHQVLPSGQSRVCLLVSDSLPVVIAPPLVSVMAFQFNQLVIHADDQPRRHPLRDEVSPLSSASHLASQ